MDKIAIVCKTQEKWDNAWKNSGRTPLHSWPGTNKVGKSRYDICILPHNKDWVRRWAAVKKGYTIISAEEYLKEGGEEVEFEIGDEIRCISITGITKKYQDETNIGIGGDYIVSHVFHDNTMGLYDVDTIVEKKDFKLKNKENNMKENNIDPKVLKVFGKEQGNLGELAIIDRHYNLGMLEEILMDKYKKEIREACKDAETKLQEEQED